MPYKQFNFQVDKGYSVSNSKYFYEHRQDVITERDDRIKAILKEAQKTDSLVSDFLT